MAVTFNAGSPRRDWSSVDDSTNLSEPQETEKEQDTTEIQNESQDGIFYAEKTTIRLDAIALEKLKLFPKKTLTQCLGKDVTYFLSGRQKDISIRDARILNKETGATVFEITLENAVEFAVDQIIRDRLARIDPSRKTSLNQISTELKFHSSMLYSLKNGASFIITKKRAEDVNAYFHKHVDPNTEIFDLERIFRNACRELIPEKKEKISEVTFIKIKRTHRKKLKRLPKDIRKELTGIIGGKFYKITRIVSKVSIKNAVIINKIAKKKIFRFNPDSIVQFTVQSHEYDNLIVLFEETKSKDKQILNLFDKFRMGKFNLTIESAGKINSFFKTKAFDLQSLLSQAVQDADEEVEKMQLSIPTPTTTRKRRLSDAEESPEREVSKKPRIALEEDPIIAEAYESPVSFDPWNDYMEQEFACTDSLSDDPAQMGSHPLDVSEDWMAFSIASALTTSTGYPN